MARAHGSYPWCREFESPFRYYKKHSLVYIYRLCFFFCMLFYFPDGQYRYLKYFKDAIHNSTPARHEAMPPAAPSNIVPAFCCTDLTFPIPHSSYGTSFPSLALINDKHPRRYSRRSPPKPLLPHHPLPKFLPHFH